MSRSLWSLFLVGVLLHMGCVVAARHPGSISMSGSSRDNFRPGRELLEIPAGAVQSVLVPVHLLGRPRDGGRFLQDTLVLLWPFSNLVRVTKESTQAPPDGTHAHRSLETASQPSHIPRKRQSDPKQSIADDERARAIGSLELRSATGSYIRCEYQDCVESCEAVLKKDTSPEVERRARVLLAASHYHLGDRNLATHYLRTARRISRLPAPTTDEYPPGFVRIWDRLQD